MRVTLILLFSLISFETLALEKISWRWLDQKEKQLSQWAKSVGSDNLIALGKTKQRPNELQVIESFFPYLLPAGYFGRSTKLSCASEFKSLREGKDEVSKNKWRECLQGIYKENIPPLQAKALKEL